jgi:DNA-binding transcriptional MerR regulator
VRVTGYLISEAARLTGEEAHVLRFWEEELELEIPRNSQGHRCYTEENIQMFHRIKKMKEAGLPLKTIKETLTTWDNGEMEKMDAGDGKAVLSEKEALSEYQTEKPIALADAKLQEFESIVYDIVTEALRNNNEKLGKAVSDRVNDKVVKELNYLMRENEENMEEHFRKLDEALIRRGRSKKTQMTRQLSRGQKEAAASRTNGLQLVSRSRKKRRLFSKKRKTAVYEMR